MRRGLVLQLLVVACFFCADASAQFSTVINVPPDILPSFTIDSGVQVNVFDGALISSIGSLIALAGSEVNIYGGVFGPELNADGGSTINIQSGSVSRLDSNSGSLVSISGGIIGNPIAVSPTTALTAGGTVNLTGGVLNGSISATSSGNVRISGASFGAVTASSGGAVRLVGGDFRLNGVLINGLGVVGNTVPINLPTNSVLSGTLADGTPFAMSSVNADSIANGTLSLEAAALPPISVSQITLPGDAAPSGVRNGQTITVNSGGILGNSFNAGWGSTVNLSGGLIGQQFEAVGANVFVSGGSIGENFRAYSGSQTAISGGSIGSGFTVASGSVVNVSGGSLQGVSARSGSVVGLSGGAYGALATVSGSALTISGGEFRLDGTLITGLDAIGATKAINVPTGSQLSGTLADGTPFAFSSVDSDSLVNGTVTLQAATLPAIGPVNINVPSDSVPLGIRQGQTLSVSSGGAVGNNFNAGLGSAVVMTGGQIGNNFEAMGANVTISGGTLGSNGDAFRGGIVSISGGTLGRLFDANAGSVVNISGGIIGSLFRALSGSEVNVSGGQFADNFNANGGSALTISGSEFRINNVPVAGLDTVGSTLALNLPVNSILSGTFPDGTPFAFSDQDSDQWASGTLTLESAAVPVIGPAEIHVPSASAPKGIRQGQTLVVNSGGVVGDNVTAGPGSTVVIQGGQIGTNFEAVGAAVTISGGTIGGSMDAGYGSIVNISGGTFGEPQANLVDSSIDVLNGSVVNVSGSVSILSFETNSGGIANISGGSVQNVSARGGVTNISGGTIQFGPTAYSGAIVNVSGGSVGDGFDAQAGSAVNISGGSLGETFFAAGVVNVTGGSFGRFLRVGNGGILNISGGTFGDSVQSNTGSTIKLSGGEFRLNGVPIGGLSSIGSTLAFNLASGAQLSGVLGDGTPFAFSSTDADTLKNGTLALERVALPAAGPAIIHVPAEPAPKGIRQGQTLMLSDGGMLGDNFNADWGSQVIISGGTVGVNFEAIGANVTITGGNFDRFIDAFYGSVFKISGGNLSSNFDAFDGSIVNLSGNVSHSLTTAFSGSKVNISGGTSYSFNAQSGSILNVAGGSFDDDFDASSGSAVNLIGTQFILDGVDITSTLMQNQSLLVSDRNVTLSGILADNSPFSFQLNTTNAANQDFFASTMTLTIVRIMPGDFNSDGVVDAADYIQWRDTLGQTVTNGTGADGNYDGQITDADYGIWRSHFGHVFDSIGADSSKIPEPLALLHCCLAVALVSAAARIRRSTISAYPAGRSY